MSKPRTIVAQENGIVSSPDPHPEAFRLEIDEFVQDKYRLNLFLLALEALQDNSVLKPGSKATDKQNQDYWWSFYSIAGMFEIRFGRHRLIAS